MGRLADTTIPQSIEITSKITLTDQETILTPEALSFVAKLERTFRANRRQLLHNREMRQARIDAGELPDFLTETISIRSGNWKVDPVPADLLDRRVEITGP